MRKETLLNAVLLVALIALPLWAWRADEPFLITLATRAVIFAIAGIGLNVALGFGGLVSFGHAAFFGIGGYVMGVLAYHAQSYTPLRRAAKIAGGKRNPRWKLIVNVEVEPDE